MKDFAAIDFETANQQRTSVCSVGIVIVRVGKTFLIKQALKDRITFQHTGVSPVDQDNDRNRLKTQLESFYYALLNQGLEGYKMPKSWMEAFFLLEQLLQDQDNGERQVIFIDELPWMDTPRSGFLPAFEEVCWQHFQQIKQALGVAGVKTSISAWNVKGTEKKEGTQIDLLIIRNDNVVNLCEMKFASAPYTISKEEEQRLRHRIECLKATLSPKQSIHLTMITTYGVAYGKHSGIVQKEVKMEDLFK